MIYKFRVILDVEEDVFRDIEIEADATLENLHHAIKQYFGFEGNEMASFYICDREWAQGEEIALLNMREADEEPIRLMGETSLRAIVNEGHSKLIYVYDFLNLWTCYVELMKTNEKEIGKTYPNLLFARGDMPKKSSQKRTQRNHFSVYNNLDDDSGIQPYDDLNFEEHWN